MTAANDKIEVEKPQYIINREEANKIISYHHVKLISINKLKMKIYYLLIRDE